MSTLADSLAGRSQDTVSLGHGKHYLRDCYIEDNVDFIFGILPDSLQISRIYHRTEPEL